MGLAASQARLIALTARMDDVEYQGQQINNQRLTLSNKVTTLYDNLVNMVVPTPPNITDYTDVVYSFRMGTTSCRIESVLPDGDATYTVTTSFNRPGSTMNYAGDLHITATDDGAGNISYSVGNSPIYTLTEAMAQTPPIITQENLEGYILAIRHAFTEYSNPEEVPDDVIMDKFSMVFPPTNESSRAEYATSSTPSFMLTADVHSALPENDTTWVHSYHYTATGTYEDVQTYTGCSLSFNSSGVAYEIQIPIGEHSQTYSLTATSETNQEAYDRAFEDYEVAKYRYDKEQQEINKMTEIIQEEDKKLQLKLTRLDNERNALKTEMDAVKKVLQDNIEGSFKTFSG